MQLKSENRGSGRLGIRFLGLLALVFTANCGKDSYLVITEEKVPMPPVRPLTHSDIQPEPPKKAMARPKLAPLPPEGRPIRWAPPKAPNLYVKGNFDGDAEAQFTLTDTGAIRTFDKLDLKDCALIEAPNHPSLYLIHFEKISDRDDRTGAAFYLKLYGAGEDAATIQGRGDVVWEHKATEDLVVKSKIDLDLGDDLISSTSRPNRFENQRYRDGAKELISACTFELKKDDFDISASFNCSDLANGASEVGKAKVNAFGKFKCPLRKTENYPGMTIERVIAP